jgi:two-component system phosphate regulon sensor histidine kinase PhoR
VLAIDAEQSVGRRVEEVVRRPELQRFIERTLSGRDIVEEDIVILADTERHLRVRGTTLVRGEGDAVGAVVVLNDMTKIRRLETMRRDFVANVSHELKTPITAVKGFVETLRGGAMAQPEEAERFLGIIDTQVDRLDAIIDDLLELSRIEKESGGGEIALEDSLLKEIVHGAIQTCEPQAATKGIRVRISCDEGIRARVNPALLERALVNLLDNAIKYSDSGKAVSVEVEESASEITLRVRDEGCGIPSEHLPRLFERFYRVDKARSRKLGGTGLGLAIVKHIAQDHGGSVTVESEPEQGSTFTIHLPKCAGKQ